MSEIIRDTHSIKYLDKINSPDDLKRLDKADMPKLADGVLNEKYGVNVVTLTVDDIKDQFDVEYHH